MLRLAEKHGLDLTGKSILDAGCGSGYSTELISRTLRPFRLEAFDFAPEQIEAARQRAARENLNVDFFVGDVLNMDFPPEIFDAVFIFLMIHEVPDQRQALSEIQQVLRPGGVLLIEARRTLSRCFSWDKLEDDFRAAGFRMLECHKLVLGFFRIYLCDKPTG